MKKVVLLAAVLAATFSHAQFTLLPQAGFEQARAGLNYATGLKSCDITGNFKAALQAGYQIKGGHTPFVRLATSPAATRFVFDNAGDLVSRTAAGALLARFEGGYQYSSKAISLGKKKSVAAPTVEAAQQPSVQRSGCGLMSRLSCGAKKKAPKAATANNLNMRLQPSLAFAYVPAAGEAVTSSADGFAYRAAAWKTAVVPALGFEFANGAKRLFTLTAFYTRPLGLEDQTVSTGSGAKAVNVPLQPSASTWGLTFGVPLSFAKAATAPKAKPQTQKRECNKTYTVAAAVGE